MSLERHLVPYCFQGPLLLLNKFPLPCKTPKRQLSRQVLTQAYKEKTGTEQGTKVEATEKEARQGQSWEVQALIRQALPLPEA